ncbi:hypothetical protein AB2S62_19950 [Vibrio sp. NTOU-M3]|uniref:hypothetical protein n=1 Tax=Vibrio sp. NTOU-M3 TaxID=3234954 RepID=UPI00349F32FD
MRNILILLLFSISTAGLCNEGTKYSDFEWSKTEEQSIDFSEAMKGFKELQAYKNTALGIWQCNALSSQSGTSVLSLQEKQITYYNDVDKYEFKLFGESPHKEVELMLEGLKVTRKMKHRNASDELEFDYATQIVSFKSSSNIYGTFANYQCTKKK